MMSAVMTAMIVICWWRQPNDITPRVHGMMSVVMAVMAAVCRIRGMVVRVLVGMSAGSSCSVPSIMDGRANSPSPTRLQVECQSPSRRHTNILSRGWCRCMGGLPPVALVSRHPVQAWEVYDHEN